MKQITNAESLEESLKALQTDYIDIMLFHGADDTSILFHEAVIRAFHDSCGRRRRLD